MIKKGSVIGLILFLTLNSVYGQLTGSAFLGSQSSHSGIKVKFKANPGTAVTDSTFTDAAGNYSINITAGSYNIEYSKSGFQTTYYAGNTAQLLTNTVVLSGVTLAPGNYVNISGNLTGTLVNTNIYIVVNPITVPFGSTLTIQPGTIIKFDAFHPFTVNGVLLAQGTASNKILFTSNKSTPAPNDWVGVDVKTSLSVVKHCILEYGHHGLNLNGSSPVVEYNEVRNFWYYGITGSNGIVRYNTAHHSSNNSYAYGISGYGIVECNEVYAGGTGCVGILAGATSTVQNNYCHNMLFAGIKGWYTDTAVVRNNVLANNGYGIYIEGESLVLNNTLYNNHYGIFLELNVGDKVQNNIVVNCVEGISRGFGQNTQVPTQVMYNLVWNNTSNYVNVGMPSIGQPLGTNANGDPTDAYFNFSVDPNFVNGIPPFLNSGSHAYGVGNPAYSANVGANTNLICSNIVLGMDQINNDLDIGVYPNPFYDQVIVKLPTDNIIIKLMDILGKEIKVGIQEISSDELKVTIDDVNPGIYFLRVSNGNSAKTIKLIKN